MTEFVRPLTNDATLNDSNLPIRVLTGDDVTDMVTFQSRSIRLGRGLIQRGERVLCLNSGALRHLTDIQFNIDDKYVKHYYPQKNDNIVGIIEDRGSDYYKVNMFGTTALLSRLAFQGATKRNKPDLKRGDIVYCRVSDLDINFDVMLSCIALSGVKKDWSSGEAIYGGLRGGLLLHVSVAYAMSLLHPESFVLRALGQFIAFEVAIGMNGCIWIKASTPIESIMIKNAILNSENLDNTSISAMITVLLDKLKSKR